MGVNLHFQLIGGDKLVYILNSSATTLQYYSINYSMSFFGSNETYPLPDSTTDDRVGSQSPSAYSMETVSLSDGNSNSRAVSPMCWMDENLENTDNIPSSSTDRVDSPSLLSMGYDFTVQPDQSHWWDHDIGNPLQSPPLRYPHQSPPHNESSDDTDIEEDAL